MGMGQNLVPLVNIKIAGTWMFIPLKMELIGIDPYPDGLGSFETSNSTQKREQQRLGPQGAGVRAALQVKSVNRPSSL
jgi:hypothetical protein